MLTKGHVKESMSPCMVLVLLVSKKDVIWRMCVDCKAINNIVRTYVFHMLRTYVMILCNWLILWRNTLYLYLGRLMMCLNTSRNHISRSSVEAFKSVQEIKQECKFIKARQLVDSFLTPPICRDLKNFKFQLWFS